jgi:hypothetical protein
VVSRGVILFNKMAGKFKIFGGLSVPIKLMKIFNEKAIPMINPNNLK